MSGLKFYNKSGTFTAYALSCGYVERNSYKQDSDNSVTLWRVHGAYHVRYSLNDSVGYTEWNTFDTLTQARKEYRRATSLIRSNKGVMK